MNTYINNLKVELDQINLLMFDLLSLSKIERHRNDPNSSVVFITPDYYWGEPTDQEKLIQIKLKKKFQAWVENFNALNNHAPNSMKSKVRDTITFINNWIEKSFGDWSVPKNIEQAKAKFKEETNSLYEILRLYEGSTKPRIILIPDTNAILEHPDPTEYRSLANADIFTFTIIPTILSELDSLKMRSSNPNLADKAKRAIKRLKGYLNQGDTLQGVIVDSTITVKMIAIEPDFKKTLSWLDQNNKDDRILASVLEIQWDFPSDGVVLVTGDINLQNKAKIAYVPFLDYE